MEVDGNMEFDESIEVDGNEDDADAEGHEAGPSGTCCKE